MQRFLIFVVSFFAAGSIFASSILIPMDDAQKNHLKAYGLAYWALKGDLEIHWLLNYRGGSFLIPNVKAIANECVIRGISYETVSDAQKNSLLAEIANPEVNQDAVKLEKARIAVYSPKGKQPWDDAVTLVLKYAEIPYDVLYDEEIFLEKLRDYDWLHLHHEDFTGQYGKFYGAFQHAAWYQSEVRENEAMAKKLGFEKVSLMKLHTAKNIKDFVFNGGFLFAMCSATDSYDIALAAEGIDICETMFDHDPADRNANSKIDYSKAFAFENYKLSVNPYEYEYSTIDTYTSRRQFGPNQKTDLFTLFEFSAKWDPVPTMLCQNHTSTIQGFWGQTAGFNKNYIKKSVLIMGESKAYNEARYIHGDVGKGTWTFFSGHDPEDYEHRVEEPPTDLSLHPNSPGYRLILNNILFPAAKKKKTKDLIINFILRIIISAVSVFLVAELLSGVKVDDYLSALLVAVVLAFLNAIVKPILTILTIPITIVTLGLFLIVINALIIIFAERLVSGFHVDGFLGIIIQCAVVDLHRTSELFCLREKEEE